MIKVLSRLVRITATIGMFVSIISENIFCLIGCGFIYLGNILETKGGDE